MTTAATTLLGLALPVSGELSGTWGDTVNNAITSLVDTAIAGTTTLSTDADATLTSTSLAINQARQAILLCTGARTALRYITAPAQSKTYAVINSTTGGFAVVVRGTGPTTGVSIPAGYASLVAWNGSDFVVVATTSLVSLTAGVSGILPVANGGTGAATLTGLVFGNGTGAFTVASAGQVTASLTTIADTTTINSQQVGYRNVPQNSQSAPYTLVLADGGKHIYMASVGVYTIPANASVAFPIGTGVTFVNLGAASTIAITSDTMYLAGVGTTGTRTLAQYGSATALKVSSTTWVISGAGLS